MPALIPGEQHQAVGLVGEPLEDVDKFKYFGSMFAANGCGTEEIRSRINLARFASSRLQFCLWSRLEISRKDWVKVSSALAQDRRAWSASVQYVVNSIGDARSTLLG